ncbi:MAG: alanine racemase [Alistipes sp.]|nr:alanine racemase [Alistipes sp.]
MNYLLSDIARICGGRLCGVDRRVRRVATDSRSCSMGDDVLFAAIAGDNHDGHDFIGQMFARGVEAFIVERQTELPSDGCGAVVVDSSIDALQRLAAFHRRQFKGRVAAIAGSNGKTIVKEWIAAATPREVKYVASPMSYNSQLGVALSLLMIEGDEQVAYIEAGISRPGEMARLERMIRPEIVVFTSIGDAHSVNFESRRQKIDEKLALAAGASTIIYSSRYPDLAERIVALYGDRRLIDSASLHADCGHGRSEALHIDSQHTAALCSVLGYEFDPQRVCGEVAMRLELKQGIGSSTIIDDTYNSDINSLAVALDMLHAQAMGRRKIAVLSDIEQSGTPEEELYARVAEIVAQADVDRLVGVGAAIGRHADMFGCDAVFYSSTDELLHALPREDWSEAAILLKGSRSSRLERVCHRLERKSHTTVLEVDLSAMKSNLDYYRRLLPPHHMLMAMVKAGSYGAGDAEVAQMLQHEGIAYLAVAFADEGVTLRERGITMPVVVLNADEDSFEQMISYDLEPEIYSFRSLDAFARAAERASRKDYPIHIKLDTGMHRLGFMPGQIDRLADRLVTIRSLRVATVFSHLNCSDTPSQDDYTRAQIALYNQMSSSLCERLPYRVVRHTAQSAGMERFPEALFDMCRLGLGLYGFGFEHNEALTPVSTLRTRIVQIKHLPAGECVGYGRAGVLARDSVTATIPVGYADGLDRHLGCGRWSMLVAGRPAPVVGRICMDSCMIDITDIEGVEEGDEVVVFSAERGNTLEDMARVLDTISYEIMASVSTRVKRIYRK